MPERLERLLAAFDRARPRVLSLDVFDTLLFRPFARPSDLFWEVHRTLREAGHGPLTVPPGELAWLRVNAESNARAQAPGYEVRLPEIAEELARMLGGAPAAEALHEAELAAERAHIELDGDIAALVRHAAAKGVPYVLTSDMYLSAADIQSLLDAALARANVQLPMPAHVFVSSEHRTGKAGRLFPLVLAQMSVGAHEVFHVGDNAHSDVESPKRQGLHTFHYEHVPRELEAMLAAEDARLSLETRHTGDLALRTLRAKIVGAHRVARTDDEAGELSCFDYGVTVFGPILAAFADWVVEDCVRHGVRVVHCLMREGHLLAPLIERAARAASDDLVVKKLWTSRYALRAASFHQADDRELLDYFEKREHPPLATVARDLGVPLEDLATVLHASLDAPSTHQESLDPAEQRALVAAIVQSPTLRAAVVRASAGRRDRLFAYFAKEGVFAHDLLTVVDLGWGGTIQRTMAHAFRDHDRPRHVRGLYLATHDKLLELPHGRCSAASFLFHLGEPRRDWLIVQRTPEILEQVCMPPEGSFRGIDGEGQVENFPQPIPAHQLADIAELQRGILAFADGWLPNLSARRGPRYTWKDAERMKERLRAILIRSIEDPSPPEVRLFDRWVHDANDGSNDTHPLLGDAALRRDARFMTHEQIRALSWLECYWPQGLAVVANRPASSTPRLLASLLRRDAGWAAASFVSRSLAKVAAKMDKP
ncbi:MAG: hypothetical protein IPJ34_27660 [Myxococcales bacterium]|nr:hypothetical protein [Myxococcales bacterium]